MKKRDNEIFPLDIRPYQIMCLICSLGRKTGERYQFENELDSLKDAIISDKNTPLRLRCNVESTFRFQNPGRELDTNEGEVFNDRRDLSILQKLGFTPGVALPASELIELVGRQIPSCNGICGFSVETSKIWEGCKFAKSGNYERGLKEVPSIFGCRRLRESLVQCKKETAEELYKKDVLEIRPHHLLCMGCFWGSKYPDNFKPIAEDHLFEAIDICRKNPDIPIKLIAGPCMICTPCPGYHPDTGMCSMSFGMGLRDQKKDLDTLRILGLNYGDVVPAGKLFKMLFGKIENVAGVCGFDTSSRTGPAWTICYGENNTEGNLAYQKARETGMLIQLGLTEKGK